MADKLTPEELEEKQRTEEIFRRAKEIEDYERAFWIDQVGYYDKDDLQDIEFDRIDESFQADDLREIDVDDYWAHGWVNDYGYFTREDAWDWENNTGRRVFPTRYRLADFRLSKSLRRVRNKNRDLITIIRPLQITPAKEALYELYDKRFYEKVWRTLAARYPVASYQGLWLMETCSYFENNLVAYSIFQVAEHSATSILAAWDLRLPKRSLGIFTVLLEMDFAAKKGFDYYYLSDYTKYNELYQYKLRFPGLEFYDWDNYRWLDGKSPEAAELLDQKLTFHYKRQKLKWYRMILQVCSDVDKSIVASAIVGSHAKKTAREDSDIDIIILTNEVENFINDETFDWAKRFGSLREQKTEDWGAVKTIRAFYKNGQEIEFNFAKPDWAKTDPVDKGTRRVVADGMDIVYDPKEILKGLKKTVSETQNK